MSLDLLAKALNYDGTEAAQRMLLGGLVGADWQQALIARGYGWHADVGAFSTPIQGGGAGTVLDQDQPEFTISVPSGYTLIPVRFHVACQVPISAADSDENEILLAVDRAAAQDGTGTATAETPCNMRTNTASGCPATVRSAYTADATNPTLNYELAHAVKVVDYVGTPATANENELSLVYEPKFPPFIVGPACVLGYWGGTVAVTGFANLDFIVVLSTLITPLS